ncbi:uncharacterized protein LOC127808703 isoform X2 [Diospyros lotus]|uniref:uncharacterized protein LOC127808703 isoform X1 n=1 Tax=Diospyros lotus TaxID=55363 RepID=UPI00224F334B|nr:uncharacterized protein LOC127808703 isoform X1 [Diospyros lotus]XP_052203241.1 uncharacterized protein LOC127808703 isoform X2 [Diospyros lotus]
MAQFLNLPRPPPPAAAVNCRSSTRPDCSPRLRGDGWASVRRGLDSNGRFTCLFSDNRREEQARKALESALGGKKTEFEKWDKEIKKREEAGGGGDTGGGGWFRWGRWFGGSNDDNSWQEAQQASLAVLGIILMYLIIAKGEVMLAVVFNPLLFALRGMRNGLTFITSWILRTVAPASHVNFENIRREEVHTHISAKERVVRKWGNE